MDYLKLAELIFSDVTQTPDEIEARYPARNLPADACVTRMAPSPTGFLHIGALFGAMTDERIAHISGGRVYLRIEDTDQKREVDGAVECFINTFAHYGIKFDEGAIIGGDCGDYGPYRQRQRADIYRVFAKKLMEQGYAYPCFCTEEELSEMRAKQESQKCNFGYWGEWARHRNATFEEIEADLAAQKPFVIRFRSPGDPNRRVQITDAIKGKLEFPENDQDIVLLKSDGIPTYHFAHVVDDHLMGTTHVVRGDEWIATLPVHVQLFGALDFKLPKYCHTATLMKLDGTSKRKISKRKDPEADLEFYTREGYPAESVREYVMTLLNSNFEEWRRDNQSALIEEFPFTFKKMSVSGALFDLSKLSDVSKNVVCRMDAKTVYNGVCEWACKYNPNFYALLIRDPDYSRAILNIGRTDPKPRKDFSVWSEVPEYLSFFFKETFRQVDEFPEKINDADLIIDAFLDSFDISDDQTVWFDKLKIIAENLGYASDTKTYKKNPTSFKGHVGDISMILRIAVTGRTNAPDLYSVMQILGDSTVRERLEHAKLNTKEK